MFLKTHVINLGIVFPLLILLGTICSPAVQICEPTEIADFELQGSMDEDNVCKYKAEVSGFNNCVVNGIAIIGNHESSVLDASVFRAGASGTSGGMNRNPPLWSKESIHGLDCSIAGCGNGDYEIHVQHKSRDEGGNGECGNVSLKIGFE